MQIRKIASLLMLLIAGSGAVMISGCQRELDCFDCPIPPGNTPTARDTTRIDSSLTFQYCSQCNSTQPLPVNSWSLKNYNSYLCGTVNYSYFDPGHLSFGFGGDLACNPDTSFILNASFSSLPFTVDRYNVSTTSQALTLKDQRTYQSTQSGYVLRTGATAPASQTLTVVVDTFLNSSRLMVGRFYGYAYTKENNRSYVEGRFRMIIQ